MTQHSTELGTWIRRYHRTPDAPLRLVCFPHAGGSASFYFPLSAALAPRVEVCAVQYPGRQDRRTEPNVDSIGELADMLYHTLLPLAETPMAFFGHSMGAIVAYEVALRLEQKGAPPLVRLYVSGRRAPSRYRDERVHEQGDPGILAELQRLRGTNSALLTDPETVEMIIPALRADYRAIETYRHQPNQAVTCPLVVFVGDQDPRVSLDEAKAWAEHSTGRFALHQFPGGHFYLSEHSEEVIDALARDLIM